MAVRTSVGSGNWSAAGTWDTGVPADGDSAVIAAGHTVVFDVDQSAWVAGLAGLTITGTLRFTTAAVVTYLKTAANITGTGAFYVGNSELDPIPRPAVGSANRATVELLAATYINVTTTEMYGWTPAINRTTVAVNAAAGALQVVLTDDLGLQPGDVVVLGTSGVVGAMSAAVEPSQGEFTVQAYNAGTKTVTLTAALGYARTAGDLVAWLSRPILLTRPAEAASAAVRYCASFLSGVRWERSNGVNPTGVNTATMRFCSASKNNLGATCLGGFSYTGTVSAQDCTAFKVRGSAAYYCDLSEFTDCTLIQTDYMTNLNYNHRALMSGCYMQNGTGLAQGGQVVAFDCVVKNCNYPLLTNVAIGYAVRCVVQNSQSGLSYTHGTHTFIDCQTQGTTFDIYMATGPFRAFNTVFGGITENQSQRYYSAHDYAESIDHDGVAGAFRAWCRGGTVNSDIVTVYPGRVRSYQHVCSSADYPVFRQSDYTLEPGQTIRVTCYARRDAAMAGYLPRLQLIDPSADPLVDASESPLDEDIMSVGVDTWETLTVEYENALTRTMEIRVRTLAMAAAGNVFFDPGVITRSVTEGVYSVNIQEQTVSTNIVEDVVEIDIYE